MVNLSEGRQGEHRFASFFKLEPGKLHQRPLQNEADILAIARLLEICESVDQQDQMPSVDVLWRVIHQPPPNIQQFWQLWESHQGQIIGVSTVRIPKPQEQQEACWLFAIHPEYRWVGLETYVYRWATTQIQRASPNPFRSTTLQVSCRSSQPQRIAFLEANGFHADRYFYHMQRSLQTPFPTPQFPPGFAFRPIHPTQDVERWVDLYNQTFIDHWHYRPVTVALRQYRYAHPYYHPQLDFVAIAPDGTFAGFCEGEINLEHNARTGNQAGWIVSLGTRRGYRQQGLGRAMLLAVIQTLQAMAMETVVLDVDTENPTGALRLYESVGFQPLYSHIAYAKQLAWQMPTGVGLVT